MNLILDSRALERGLAAAAAAIAKFAAAAEAIKRKPKPRRYAWVAAALRQNRRS